MIHLSGLQYAYEETGGDRVLKGVDLEVEKGARVLLCGASGSGKSTLGYALNGLIPHFFGGRLEGSVLVGGVDPRRCTVADLLPFVGLVFQNAEAQLFCTTVEDEIAYGLESLGYSPDEIHDRIHKTAQTLQITSLLSRSPSSLSGGEKRLVAIASVLGLRPSVLVLDEPLAHLDRTGADRVKGTLKTLHDQGQTILIIEQRVGMVLDEVEQCVVMDQGKVLFDGPPKQAEPALSQCRLVPCYPCHHAPPAPGPVLLEVRGLSQSLNQRKVLKDVSLDLRQGEIVALTGENGSGKTTLMKHFNGILKPQTGEVRVLGQPLRGRSPAQVASLVGISFQNPNDQFFKNSVREELAVGMSVHKGKGNAWLEELVGLLDLSALLDRPPYRLSEGQKKRVALASILVMEPRILVLDEPTVGQDGRNLEIMAGILLALRDRGLGILFATHDLEFARAVADRWIVLKDGRAEEWKWQPTTP